MKSLAALLLGLLLSAASQAREYEIIDRTSFERPMVAATVELPDDWRIQSNILWGRNPCGGYLWHIQAWSGDGEVQLEGLPSFTFSGSANPMTHMSLQSSIAQQVEFTGHCAYCAARMVGSIQEFVSSYYVPVFRPGAEIKEFVPDVEATASSQQELQLSIAAMQGLIRPVNAEVAKVRLDYLADGKRLSEWIWVQLTATENTMVGYVDTRVGTLTLRAPSESIDRYENILDHAIVTTNINPQWQARVNQALNQMSQSATQHAGRRAQIMSESQREIGNMMQQGYEARQQTLDELYDRSSRARLGIGGYTDPLSGQRYEAEYGHDQIWVNQFGEYLPGSDPYFDPNLGSDTQWMPAEPDWDY